MYEVLDGAPHGPVFVFGENSAATSSDYGSAGMGNEEMQGAAVQQQLRIVIDELLLGNYLEEIQCNGVVDSDAFAMVPVGATPDDIARCAVAPDVLKTTCPGSNPHSVCICQLDSGCTISGTDPVVTVPKGESVGIKDANEDGSDDKTRFIDGAVGIRCGTTDVPIDLDNSYWNPSGDQQKPAMGGFDALGPAIVIAPAVPLPTNEECGLTFSPDVVDDTNIQVCAPPNGDVTQDCTPGDVSAFKFHTVSLALQAAGLPSEGDTGVDPTANVVVATITPIPFDPATVNAAAITIHDDTANTNFTNFTVSVNTAHTQITLAFPAGLAPNTMYTITYAATITDTYGQPLAAPFVLDFTTGA
ncbi:MAG TPA: Ig-like domain-containing protein [Kofleriaceae bacterium]